MPMNYSVASVIFDRRWVWSVHTYDFRCVSLDLSVSKAHLYTSRTLSGGFYMCHAKPSTNSPNRRTLRPMRFCRKAPCEQHLASRKSEHPSPGVPNKCVKSCITTREDKTYYHDQVICVEPAQRYLKLMRGHARLCHRLHSCENQ